MTLNDSNNGLSLQTISPMCQQKDNAHEASGNDEVNERLRSSLWYLTLSR